MAENFPTTPTGYVVLPAGSRLQPKDEPPVEVAWVAVVGVRVGRQRLSLAQDALRRAARVVRQDEGPEVGAAILFYLAQIGFSPAGSGEHLRWPPLRNGRVEQDRRYWRRPYISALTSNDLYHHLLPAAEAAVLCDETAAGVVYETRRDRRAAALRKLPPAPKLRTEDGALHDAVRWHTGAFAYVAEEDAGPPAVRRDLVRLARTWASGPRSHRLSDSLAGWIYEKTQAGDVEALGTVLRMLREGHVRTHSTIRHHQHCALDDLHASGAPRLEEFLGRAAGLHELLYAPIPLFGFETWQFTAGPDGVLRITLPEIVGLGRDGLGRQAWLDPLMATYARRDEAAACHQLDRLRQLLALLGSDPEALLMRDAGSTEDAWDALDLDLDPVDMPLSDEDTTPGASRRHRPDEEAEENTLFALAQAMLRDRLGLWEAFYWVKIEQLPLAEAAVRLNLKSKSAVKARADAAQQILEQDPRMRDWRTD